MACTSQNRLIRTELQTEPILPGGYGLLKALGALVDVLQDALELSRTCSRMAQRARGRRELRMLDARTLADIGLTRETADSEARKWFWQ